MMIMCHFDNVTCVKRNNNIATEHAGFPILINFFLSLRTLYSLYFFFLNMFWNNNLTLK